MSKRPALLGSSPIFDQRVNFVRPCLPSFSELSQEIEEVLESGMLTKGRHLDLFEQLLAEHLGVKYAVAVSSCTAGLMLTYQALQLSGEAIVPSFTFMATVSALRWAGVSPVFADVDRATMNLDPMAAHAAITPRTSAIVAVHNFGNPADIDCLQAIADQNGLRLIFDAAHAFGTLAGGNPIGVQGDAQVYSLTPSKLLVAGEGGIIATNSGELARQVRIGREYGNGGGYDSAFPGLNARMSEISAILGKHSLRRLEDAARQRNNLAELYRAGLSTLPGIGFQEVSPGNRSSYTYFSITVDPDAFGLTRDELALSLAEEGVDTRKYYDPPVHRQTAYEHFAQAELPNTDLLSSRVLSLPVWSKMDRTIVMDVCQAIVGAHEYAPEVKETLTARLTAAAG